MPRLRFHWDFFGTDAQRTAEHFLHHVDEFCAREGISGQQHWTKAQGMVVVATMECDEQHMLLVRDRLRPKRAERVLA